LSLSACGPSAAGGLHHGAVDGVIVDLLSFLMTVVVFGFVTKFLASVMNPTVASTYLGP